MQHDSTAPPARGDFAWIMRELSRLEKTKADKAYVVQIEKLIEQEKKNADKEADETKLSFGKDISALRKEIGDVKKCAENPACIQEEEIADMNAALSKVTEANENLLRSQTALTDNQNFWSRWFMRGMVGFIVFLLGTGSVWVYSYFSIKSKTDEAQQTTTELKTLVSQVQQTQKAYGQDLEDISRQIDVNKPIASDELKKELKLVLQEALAENKAKR